MLRRLPTALTISPEDIAAYEAKLTRRLAYLHFKKTGEDPEGLFTDDASANVNDAMRIENDKPMDPNDELKPLPGLKARIVRGQEDRIMGVPGGR